MTGEDPGWLLGGGEAGVETRTQFVGRYLRPGSPLTLAVHDHTGGTENSDHAGQTEQLRPPHEHVR